jgi:hypothetical protein
MQNVQLHLKKHLIEHNNANLQNIQNNAKLCKIMHNYAKLWHLDALFCNIYVNVAKFRIYVFPDEGEQPLVDRTM